MAPRGWGKDQTMEKRRKELGFEVLELGAALVWF